MKNKTSEVQSKLTNAILVDANKNQVCERVISIALAESNRLHDCPADCLLRFCFQNFITEYCMDVVNFVVACY